MSKSESSPSDKAGSAGRLDELPDIIHRARAIDDARNRGGVFGKFPPNEALALAWAVRVLADRERTPPSADEAIMDHRGPSYWEGYQNGMRDAEMNAEAERSPQSAIEATRSAQSSDGRCPTCNTAIAQPDSSAEWALRQCAFESCVLDLADECEAMRRGVGVVHANGDPLSEIRREIGSREHLAERERLCRTAMVASKPDSADGAPHAELERRAKAYPKLVDALRKTLELAEMQRACLVFDKTPVQADAEALLHELGDK